jgi:hypothetical protein
MDKKLKTTEIIYQKIYRPTSRKRSLAMKKYQIFLIYFLLSNITLVAQNHIEIFDPSKIFVYVVFFIEKNGDTLTQEKITFQRLNKPWIYQRKQSELEIIYEPDYSGLMNFVHPHKAEQERKERNMLKAKKKKSWANYNWIEESEITGMIETDSSIWLHPPRGNQYVYAYLSAYPEVYLNELKPGGNWKNKLYILKGYLSNEEFTGTVINDFKVIGTGVDTVGNSEIKDCWKIESTNIHSKLGKSTSYFVFDKVYYGFVRMEFEYYNGIKIIYRLKEVIKKE